VAPLGDRFEPDLTRGSGSYAVPFHLPTGPMDQRPQLGLSYSTGSGNGPFGLGWRLGVLRIERRTDRGVPGYDDEQDTFVLGDAEELVPFGDGRYRPRTDTASWWIARHGAGWIVRTGDGTTLLLGQSESSQERDEARVFAWYLDQQTDAAGNTITFSYRRDGQRLYPQEVAWSIFRARFTYEPRPDVLRNGRAGFLRVTALRATGLDVIADHAEPPLLRTYGLSYAQAANGASLLAGVTLSATVGAQTSRFPSLEFRYAGFDPAGWQIDALHAMIPPPGADAATTQWVDLTGDALPDILSLAGGRARLWRNRGDGWLDGPTALAGLPSVLSLDRPNVAFGDLDGNGRVDLFAVDQPLSVAYAGDGRGGFASDPVVFAQRPDLRLADPTTRLTDVDGDGVTDLLATGRDGFLLYRHQPGLGWQEPEVAARIHDLARFPDVTFGDRGVRLADMTGDGLEDLVVLRGEAAWYWPSLGNGRWGERVELDRPPVFPAGYDDGRVVVADLDGDGCADVAYLDWDRTIIWLNQSGAGFAPAHEVPVAPPPQARALALDAFGDGRPGLVWSAPASGPNDAGWRVLRLDPGAQSSLLVEVDNGMGRLIRLTYGTSSAMRQADRAAGSDWPGMLPFVVPVVQIIDDIDNVAGAASRMALRYHDGVYDGPRREFRGFGRVEVDLDGDASLPASRQEHTFFQGDPEHPDPAERDRQRALAGSPLVTQSSTADGPDGTMLVAFETTRTWDVAVETAPGGGASVYQPRMVRIEHREPGLGGEPDLHDRTSFAAFDAHGNATHIVQEWFAAGAPPEATLTIEERTAYVVNDDAWLVRLPARRERRDSRGLPVTVEVHSYDGLPHTGLPEGKATVGLLTRTRALALRAAALPAGYADGMDLAALGFEAMGDGDVAGWYATTFSVERDGRGNIMGRSDPLGRRSSITFDPDGVYPVAATDTMGSATTLTFDPRAGMPERLSLPDGRAHRFTFDPLGRVVSRFDLDDAGQEQLVTAWRAEVDNVPTSVTTITPRAPGHQPAEFGPGVDLSGVSGSSLTKTYLDGNGRPAVTLSTAPDGPGGTRRFLAAGRTMRNPRGLVSAEFAPSTVTGLSYTPPLMLDASSVRHRYDGRGNLIETTGRGPAHFRFERGAFSVRHFEGDAMNGTPSRVEHFDARRRVARIDEYAAADTIISTTYELTADGRIEVLRDGAGAEVARWTYAGPADAVRISHRDAGTRTYYRDAAGMIRRMIAADSGELRYEYDAAGRLLRITSVAAGGGAPLTLRKYIYDADPATPGVPFLPGRLAVVTEPDYTLRLRYDRAGRTTAETTETAGASLTTRSEVGLQGEVLALVYPDGRRIEFARDDSGAVRRIPDFFSEVAYDEEAAQAGYVTANGTELAWRREPASHRLLSISTTRAGGTLRSLAYRYDGVGNITGIDDTAGANTVSTTYTYDGLHRLSAFETRDGGPLGPVTRAGAYPLDSLGNLLALHEATDLTLEYADPGRPGQLTGVTAASPQAVSYDACGRIKTLGDLTEITFDALDRVTRVTRADGTEVRFVQDYQGRLVLREVRSGGAVTRTRYVGESFEQHDDRTVRYVVLGPARVASETVPLGGGPTRLSFFMFDHHGSAVLETDAAGAVIASQRYTAYGQALSAASLNQYIGRDVVAETGLVLLGARHYAPGLGRFISPDWYVLENPDKPARLPQGYHLYSYGMNNPLRFDDPTGRWFFMPFVVGFVVGLVYGYADGRGADGSWSLAKETALTTGLGFNLGWGVGMITPFIGGTALAEVTGAMGGLNGLFAGTRQIYDDIQFFGSAEGVASLVADSTWGILGTSIGNAMNIYNLLTAPSSYRSDLSKGQNRQVYDRGFHLEGSSSFTQGNVISYLAQGGPTGLPPTRLLHHESLHIFQSRAFGPLFQISYVAWTYYGALTGLILALPMWEDPKQAMIDVGYNDNPWELWAWQHGGQPANRGKLSAE
jgi:RHS repeat-associated protein